MTSDIDTIAAIEAALGCFEAGLSDLKGALSDRALQGSLREATDLIFAMKGRLILTGIGKSGHVARKLAATFASTGTPSYFVHAAEASHGDLGMIHGSDVLMLLSWSGETRELKDVVDYGARFGVPMIAVTGKAGSALSKSAQVSLVLPQAKEACPHNLAPTTSTLLQLAIGDALAVTVLQRRGFGEDSFRTFHPGGKLGSALTPVAEVMHRGDALPLVTADAPVIEVISQISAKGFGIAGMVDTDGALSGVITDGDIRRHLEQNGSATLGAVVNDAKADALMTPGGITVEADSLCGGALNALQSNSISAAFVVEKGKPVGLVTMLELLRLGVA